MSYIKTLKDLITQMVKSFLPEASIRYLNSPIAYPYILMMLILGLLYERVNGIHYSGRLTILLLFICIVMLWIKYPRYMIYGVLFVLLAAHVYAYTQRFSKGDFDIKSTRDEAVEETVKAFVHGINPWNHVYVGPPGEKVNASSGPASILFAMPVVLLFGEINWLAFLFWMLFFCALLIGDLKEQNKTFLILILLFMAGIFSSNITLQLGLDELYFPYLFIIVAIWLLNRKQYFLAGAALFVTPLFRLNYLLILSGVLLWFLFNKPWKKNNLVMIGLGGLVITVIILLPFLIVNGKEFIQHNSISFAIYLSGEAKWPDNNLLFSTLNFLAGHTNANIMRIVKLGLFSGLMILVSLRLRHFKHPFWHVTAAAFLSITITWLPSYSPIDYELLALVPAFLAVAYSPIRNGEISRDFTDSSPEGSI
jgi:hypothetical protein